MTEANITRNNHYVPEWYQKQFLLDGESDLCLLDLKPDLLVYPDGTKILNKYGKPKTHNSKRNRAPSQCFKEFDLYTTRIFGEPNDLIEKWLFGTLDNIAAKCIPKFINEDWQALGQEGYQAMLSYIDVQRLRTPSGLDFLKYLVSINAGVNFSQEELMHFMQRMRTMHITMWSECVQEIVSAEDSDIKFIVSDNPVTFYNCKAFPGSKFCNHPKDPPLNWNGTQTIFVTDPNHCMIFTHLDFAKKPKTTNPLRDRINARYFNDTVMRMDNWIRERKLKRAEVSSINYILKTRAKRYIAAGKEEWLYPEQTAYSTHWSKIRQITLPKDKLYMFGGEVFVGFEDGSVYQQDAYGRQTMSPEEAKKETQKMKEMVESIISKQKD